MRTGKKEILGTLSVSKDTSLSGDLTQRDIQRIENNIMLLGFYRSVDNSKTKYNLDNGMIDEFEDLSGIDTGNSLNYEYNTSDDYLYPTTQGVDSYTKLMLHGEGAPTITHQITVNGGAQISTAQSKFGGSSIYFDGSGDYLTIPSSSDWAFGSGDFTIDFWVRFNDLSARPSLIWRGGAVDGAIGLCWLAGGSNQIYWNHTDGSNWFTYYPSWTPTTGTWYHLAVVKYGTNFDIYVNGTTLQHVTNCTTSVADLTGALAIGAQNDNSTVQRYLNGYMDEIRISKGIARWTDTFTPPVSAYTLDEYTTLLIHGDGTNTSTAIYDAVGNDEMGKNISMNGNARLAYNAKIGTGCAVFDGTGDYISIPDSDDWSFGTGDFTIEFWLKQFSVSTNLKGIIGQNQDANNTWGIATYNGTLYLKTYYAGVEQNAYASSVIPKANTWYHIVVIRSSGSIKMYINGVSQTVTDNITTRDLTNISGNLNIGVHIEGSNYYYIDSCLDEVRISKGIARYTSNFTPSTTEFSKDSYTKLLLHFDEDYRDYSDLRGKTVTANGNVQISTSQYNVGSASIAFDGTGDYLSVPDSTDWVFNTGEFTIEFWVRFNSVSGTHDFFTQSPGGSNYTRFMYYPSKLEFDCRNSGIVMQFNCNFSPSINTWYHIALSRKGNNAYIFVNGTSQTLTLAGGAYNGAIPDFASVLWIGANQGVEAYLNGYLDEYRISNGIARYTSNFTPNTTPFTTDKYTVLLLHGEGTNGSQTIVDSSGLCATLNGDTHIEGSKFGISSYNFDGSGDYLELADNDDVYFGTGDFTIDFWVYRKDENAHGIFCQAQNSSTPGQMFFYIGGDNKFRFAVQDTSNTHIINPSSSGLFSNSPLLSKIWYHVALVRYGSRFSIYINGKEDSYWTGTPTLLNLTGVFAIGTGYTYPSPSGGGTWYNLNGLIDEFRISKGLARWTSDFTPPTSSYSQNLQNMTIQSTVNNTQTTPPSSRLVVFEEDIDTITLNTDLKGWVSRDNGTTWSQVTLTNDGSFDSNKQILAGNIDISGQPSGTQVKYKITSHNNKNLKIHGVGCSWD